MQEYLKSIEGTLLANAGIVLLGILITLIGSAIAKFLLKKVLEKTRPAIAGFVASILQFLIVLAGFYATALAAGVDPTVILAVVAILTTGISLSADHSFKNIIAGAQIVGNSKLRPGEWVTVAGDVHGVIQEIGLSSTTVASPLSGMVTLSNSSITEARIVNHTRLRTLEHSVHIPFFDSHNKKKVLEIFYSVVEQVGGCSKDPVIVHTWDDSGEHYEIVLTITSFEQRREIASAISMTITKALEDGEYPVGHANFIKNI